MSKAKAQYQVLFILALMYDCKKALSNASSARIDGHNLLFITCNLTYIIKYQTDILKTLNILCNHYLTILECSNSSSKICQEIRLKCS